MMYLLLHVLANYIYIHTHIYILYLILLAVSHCRGSRSQSPPSQQCSSRDDCSLPYDLYIITYIVSLQCMYLLPLAQGIYTANFL